VKLVLVAISVAVISALACGSSAPATPSPAPTLSRPSRATEIVLPTATLRPTSPPPATATQLPSSPTKPPAATVAATRPPATQPPAPTRTTAPVRAPVTGYTCANEAKCIKGNINADGDKIYHYPGCDSYAATQINENAGERWFTTEAEAQAAGWRKAQNCP
jgi:hypothetical protein